MGINEVLILEKRLLIILMLLVSLFPVFQRIAEAGKERWKSISANNKKEWILYDSESVIYLQKDLVRVWVMGTDNNSTRRKSLEEINCSHKIIRDIEVITEKPNMGTVNNTVPSSWHGIVRNSARGELFKILCR